MAPTGMASSGCSAVAVGALTGGAMGAGANAGGSPAVNPVIHQTSALHGISSAEGGGVQSREGSP